MGVVSFGCFSSGVLMPLLLPLLMLLAALIILWIASLDRLFYGGFWPSAAASTGSKRLNGCGVDWYRFIMLGVWRAMPAQCCCY